METKPGIDEATRVLKLSHSARYKYFIRKSVETYTVYTINLGSNYLILNDPAGTSMCCPLWPAAVFAEIWLGPIGQGAGLQIKTEVVQMELDATLKTFLPALKRRGLKVGICLDQASDGRIESVDKFIADIRREIQSGFSHSKP
ncbi:DUF2750 domain-containing protein [Phyllobacterium sp. 22229]|uniref:DUF2750 domain-containing protein n=1 Tax=Phyllobacterium myrsinacearum TaxID=28101 RepID=A0A2S9JA15_9HYPH|nr:DUF2750 domain-containing protein [Phyllobacterium myrsinacearum]PRD49646.1 hypothetical protein C5750_24800 [Phyllobacterium myrsinacearum]PWV94774.1 uncharacterized protein DUF2750 [Phyllobacterium myrsinacearum]RZS87845.1 uncharacterized protein DUF2750 [Phyllobacterium myrsinacearum]RZV07117.1 uncharacterized protein DUF2750 [Phyllobacterium myrsinacearum]